MSKHVLFCVLEYSKLERNFVCEEQRDCSSFPQEELLLFWTPLVHDSWKGSVELEEGTSESFHCCIASGQIKGKN